MVTRNSDITDLVEMLFPGNRNQQHAAARILLILKAMSEPIRYGSRGKASNGLVTPCRNLSLIHI